MYMIYLGVAAVVAWVFVTWLRRRSHRRALERMLGSGFASSKCFITSRVGIAVDEPSQRFAVVRGKQEAICKAAAIQTAGLQSTQGVFNLVIETSDDRVPRISIATVFQSERLGEISSRLKNLMKIAQDTEEAVVPEKPEETRAADLSASIQQMNAAILQLTDAITRLSLGPQMTRQIRNHLGPQSDI